MAPKFYLTTTLPYVNAEPHLGFALELVQADVSARYRRLLGEEVFFNTGTDEHGLKIYRRAQESDKAPQEFADEMAAKYKNLLVALDILPEINFIRTTDPHHLEAAQEFWRRCVKSDDIYKKTYRVKYCVGCEMEITESELINGRCPDHPNIEPETIEEENYFFRFSKYQKSLLDFYAANLDFVVPQVRFNEIKRFVEAGIKDFSISRLKEKVPWGVSVPDDPDHMMYVWFEALVNYIAAVGWPNDPEKFNQWWPAIQLAGKNNLRQQAAMWQAMLMSAGLPPSRQIVIHGFITSGGQKMSKSLGNVIDPFALVREYGTDAVRYFLLRHAHPFEDSDVTLEKFREVYNAHLANGLGNLVGRVMKLAEDYLAEPAVVKAGEYPAAIGKLIEKYEFNQAADLIWQEISALDQTIQVEAPFNLVKTDRERGKDLISHLVEGLAAIARLLEPFLPATASAITTAIRQNRQPPPLFPRKP